MNILASVHLYPPVHNCGAEYVLHHMNKYLISQGHSVKLLLWQANQHRINKAYSWEGVDVFPPDQAIIETLFDWADIVITHLDYTYQTIQLGSIYGKPVVHLIHNTHKYECVADAYRPQFIVYNSKWAEDELRYQHKSIVVHPPCDWRLYDTGEDTEQNEFITLINLDDNKGGGILREIAKRMPDRKFLGVKGSYSHPAEIGQYTDQPSNVTVINNSPDIMPVYRQTRILIMPSKYESWGRTATEAMCSGIPVISSGTPGLRENCGDAGIYVDREDIDGWVKAIKKLDNPKEYKKASAAAKTRSRELDPVKELEDLHSWLNAVRADYRGYVSTYAPL